MVKRQVNEKKKEEMVPEGEEFDLEPEHYQEWTLEIMDPCCAPEDDMTAVMAALSQQEKIRVFDAFLNNGNVTDEQQKLLKSLTAGVVAQRSPIRSMQETALMHTQAAKQTRQHSHHAAKCRVASALEAIRIAQASLEALWITKWKPSLEAIWTQQVLTNCMYLVEAQEKLQAKTQPVASGPAEAQQLIHKVLDTCHPEATKKVKEADRQVRDIMVLQCRASQDDYVGNATEHTNDRLGFMSQVVEAFAAFKAVPHLPEVLLSYDKLLKAGHLWCQTTGGHTCRL